jgi:hypothetical protein
LDEADTQFLQGEKNKTPKVRRSGHGILKATHPSEKPQTASFPNTSSINADGVRKLRV